MSNDDKAKWRGALVQLMHSYIVTEGGQLDKPDNLTDEEWAEVLKEAEHI